MLFVSASVNAYPGTMKSFDKSDSNKITMYDSILILNTSRRIPIVRTIFFSQFKAMFLTAFLVSMAVSCCVDAAGRVDLSEFLAVSEVGCGSILFLE